MVASSEVPVVPPPVRMFQIATASWMSQAVSVAASIGVADELAAGPRPVEEIAEAIGAHAPTLYRLLSFLADVEVFEELDGQRFALTDLGETLRSDSPVSVRRMVMWPGLPADRYTWAHLEDAVRTGEPPFARVQGQPFFDHLRDHPEVAEVFDQAMTEVSRQLVAQILSLYDFGSFRTIVDVAGGHGALLATILSANPQASGVLYEQPEVIAAAGKPLDQAGVRGRCELVSGDFFQSIPAGGDVYVLSNIIHDWDDERAVQILANCRAAMADHGRVLLAEAVLPSGIGPSPAKLFDLAMLVLTPGGRQRTEAELSDLFQRAGLELAGITWGELFSIVEATPA